MRNDTRDRSNKVRDSSELLLSQNCPRAQSAPTLAFVQAQAKVRQCAVVPESDSGAFSSRGTAAGALALTLSGGRDRLEEGRGGSAGAGQPKFPGFPTERLCGDPVYNPLVTGPGPAPRLPVRALAGDLCARQGSCSRGPAPHLTPSFHPEEPGTCPGEPTQKSGVRKPSSSTCPGRARELMEGAQ